MRIDDFIDIVVPKLRKPVFKSFENIRGSELKLTGVKEVKGKPIEDHKIYRMPVPVVDQSHDHKWKMKLAWLRGGKPALRTYLLKWLTSDQAASVMKFI